MSSLTEAEKAEFTAAVREVVLHDDELLNHLRERLQMRSEKPSSSFLAKPLEAMARRQVERLQSESEDAVTVPKLGVSLIAGMVGMAFVSDPGGLNEAHGFALGFAIAFLGLVVLEMIANRKRARV